MLFNSIEFAFFLPVVFFLYWFVTNKNLRLQNFLLLLASYFFYGWWDWRFLSLIFFSTCIDFVIGLQLGKEGIENPKRKYLLWASVAVNIGLLGIFKYYNFFAESFADAFALFGMPFDAARLNIILPIGISFYTFQTLSYSIDIYKKRLKPTHDFVAFATFVSFFPQLVAGPVERAINLLPQFHKSRVFDYGKAVDGMRQILLGLFKKVVIADNCAEYVNLMFNNAGGDYSGGYLLVGVILFTFQLYGDFSGYSDIAIGTARLFGFNLMQNFAFPYFSVNMTEFWRRWHISLSTWIRDYVYSPLSLSLRHYDKRYNYIIAFLTTFSLFGLWHGANWTFVIWGTLHGVVLSYEHRTRKIRKKIRNKVNKTFYFIISAFFTYLYWCFSCVLFRAESIGHAMDYLTQLTSNLFTSYPSLLDLPKKVILLAILLFALEWINRNKKHAFQFNERQLPQMFRWVFYVGVIFLIIEFSGGEQEFIYFQF